MRYSLFQAPIVSKHVYVHVAPEEPEQQRPARIIAPSQPRKHYKIVFIKAPSAPSYSAAQLQLPQQDQEKTLIYVLVKRPDDQPSLTVNAARPSAPSKPEVYFIRYKTQSGGAGPGSSGGLSSGGVSAGGSGSGPAINLGSSGAGPSFSGGPGSSGGYSTGSGVGPTSGSGSSLSSLSGGSGPSTSYGVPGSGGSGPY